YVVALLRLLQSDRVMGGDGPVVRHSHVDERNVVVVTAVVIAAVNNDLVPRVLVRLGGQLCGPALYFEPKFSCLRLDAMRGRQNPVLGDERATAIVTLDRF